MRDDEDLLQELQDYFDDILEGEYDDDFNEWSDNPLDYDTGDSEDDGGEGYGNYNPNAISSVSVVFIY